MDGLLLEQFLDLVPDPQQDHGTDDGADDLAVPLGPEGTAGTDEAQQPAADDTAEQTDDDVPDKAALILDDEEPGQPTGDRSEEQGNQDVHNVMITLVYTKIALIPQRSKSTYSLPIVFFRFQRQSCYPFCIISGWYSRGLPAPVMPGQTALPS